MYVGTAPLIDLLRWILIRDQHEQNSPLSLVFQSPHCAIAVSYSQTYPWLVIRIAASKKSTLLAVPRKRCLYPQNLVWETDAIVQPVMYYPRFLFHGLKFLLHCMFDRHRLHNERNQNQSIELVLRLCGRGIYGIKPLHCGIIYLFSSQLQFMLVF